MKVDKHIIEPFNTWWRQTNHCEPDLKAVDAFAAGFKAGVKATIEATASMGTSQLGKEQKHG